MREVSTAEVRKELSDVLNRVAYGGERVAVKRREKTIAVIVPPADAELLERLIEEEESRIDIEQARRARAAGGKPVPLAVVAAELGIPLRRKKAKRPAATMHKRKRRA
jgi:antitoxin (DNA-binding transcriptional repressor) of toxin-antitoxin stability system